MPFSSQSVWITRSWNYVQDLAKVSVIKRKGKKSMLKFCLKSGNREIFYDWKFTKEIYSTLHCFILLPLVHHVMFWFFTGHNMRRLREKTRLRLQLTETFTLGYNSFSNLNASQSALSLLISQTALLRHVNLDFVSKYKQQGI